MSPYGSHMAASLASDYLYFFIFPVRRRVHYSGKLPSRPPCFTQVEVYLPSTVPCHLGKVFLAHLHTISLLVLQHRATDLLLSLHI